MCPLHQQAYFPGFRCSRAPERVHFTSLAQHTFAASYSLLPVAPAHPLSVLLSTVLHQASAHFSCIPPSLEPLHNCCSNFIQHSTPELLTPCMWVTPQGLCPLLKTLVYGCLFFCPNNHELLWEKVHT